MQNGGRKENVSAAQGAVTSAAAKLTSLQQGRAETVAQAQANLDAAKAKLQALKDGPTQEQIHAAQLAIEQAKDAANAANVAKDAACNPAYPAAGCHSAQAAAYAATTGIDQAQAQLKILTSPPTADALQQAQAGVDAAQAALNLAQHPGSASDVSAAAGAVQSAQAQLDLAKSPYSSADLAKAQAAVDVAAQQLKLAEAPYTQQDEDAAKAAVEQAQAALSVAQVSRDQAIITSPIDGIVAQKLLSVGAVASPATSIIVLLDPAVDVVVNADASQASALHVGDAATITSDALPGKSIPGKVSLIAPAVDPQARTVQVKITPSNQDSGLKDGMLAQVTLVTGTHDGVVTVPAAAIVQRSGQPTVYVVADGVARPVSVRAGLSDGTKTEITSGLQGGQVVVVGGQDRLTTSQPVQIQK
jgi:RND family efflux transporter MFP subunit